VSGGDKIVGEAYHYVPCGQSGVGGVLVSLVYYENDIHMDLVTDCDPSGGDCAAWNRWRCSDEIVPMGATGVCVLLEIWNTPDVGTFRSAFDRNKLMPVSIFADGFESGDVSQWSNHTPS
jgi:hypothetical protein